APLFGRAEAPPGAGPTDRRAGPDLAARRAERRARRPVGWRPGRGCGGPSPGGWPGRAGNPCRPRTGRTAAAGCLRLRAGPGPDDGVAVVRGLGALVRRDLRLALRQRGDLLTAVLF